PGEVQAVDAEVGELHRADSRISGTRHPEGCAAGGILVLASANVDKDAAPAGPQLVQPSPLVLRTVEPDARGGEAVPGAVDLQEADVDEDLRAEAIVPRGEVDDCARLSTVFDVGLLL